MIHWGVKLALSADLGFFGMKKRSDQYGGGGFASVQREPALSAAGVILNLVPVALAILLDCLREIVVKYCIAAVDRLTVVPEFYSIMAISKYIADHKGLIRFLVIFNLCLIAAGWMIYKKRQARLLRNEYGHEATRARQEAFNALKYTPIVSSNGLYSHVQSLNIIQHEEIPEPQITQLRDRLFDVLWTFHIGGFENYMRLRKPEGIEYQFDFQSIAEMNANTNVLQEIERMRREHPEVDIPSLPDVPKTEVEAKEYVRDRVRSVSSGTFYTNFLSEICLNSEELEPLRNYFMNVFDENAEEFKERKESVPFGVHVFRTTEVGEPGDHKYLFGDHVRIKPGIDMPDFNYLTLNTSHQELKAEGEITLALVYLAFKSIHHEENATHFRMQMHWNTSKSCWIIDWITSGYLYPYRTKNEVQQSRLSGTNSLDCVIVCW